MAYDGYWRLGGTEIINTARTAKYVGDLMPTFGLDDCTDCDGLADALGAVKRYGPEERIEPGFVQRTNLIKDPRSVMSWASTSASMTLTHEATGGPEGVDTWAKATLTSVGTGAYRTLAQSGGLENYAEVRPGEPYFVSVEEIHSHTPDTRLGPYITWYTASGSQISQVVPAIVPGPVNQWNRVTAIFTAPATARYARVGLSAGLDTGWPVGAFIGASKWLMIPRFEADIYGSDYFDGSWGVPTLTRETRWIGPENGSFSQDVTYSTREPLLYDGEYKTPALDGAPWVDSSNPALNDFWGVYPLGVSGVDDSTRTLPVTELTTDGAITGLPRAAAREIRFDALLVGRTKQAVTAGLHWLNRALDENRCDSDRLGCSGSPLHFFSACPPACDYSACPDTPVDWRAQDPVRINWVWNPQVNVSPNSPPYSAYGNQVDVTMPGNGRVRAEWTQVPTTFGSGLAFRHTSPFVVEGYDGPSSYPAGTPVSALVDYVAVSRPDLAVRVQVELLNAAGAMVQSFQSGDHTGDTTYSALQVNGVSSVPFHGFRVILYVARANVSIQVGDWLEGTRFSLEIANSIPGYFDGSYTWGSPQVPEGHQAYWMGPNGFSAGPSAIAPQMDDLDLWSVNGVQASGPSWVQFSDGECAGPGNVSIQATGDSSADLTLTRAMTGLIPGQWYRVAANAVGGASLSSSQFRSVVEMSVRGRAGVVTYPEGAELCGAPVGQALWFQATAPVEFIDFTLPASGYTPSESDVRVYYLHVERATADFNIYSTDFSNDGTALNGWSLGTSTGSYSVSSSRDGSGWVEDVPTVQFRATAASTVIPDNQVIVQRSIRGLTPGQSYTARFGFDWSANLVSAADMTIGLQVGSTSVERVMDSEGFPTTNTIELQFVASAEQEVMTLRLGASYSLPVSGNSLSVNLIFATVERNETGPVPYPDGTLDFQRTLYRVSALTGPTITEQYDKDCGYMVRVSFGLVAGVPHQYGPLLEAGSALGGSSAPLQQVDCVNGEAVRTNLILNPSLEYGLTGWQKTSSGGTFTRTSAYQGQMWQSTYGGRSGTYIGQLSAPGGTAQQVVRTGGTIPVVGFQWVAVRALVASDTVPLPNTGGVRMSIQWVGSTEPGAYSEYINPTFYGGGEIVLSARAPADATGYYVEIIMFSGDVGSELVAGKRLWWDAVISTVSDSQGQAEALLAPYFDGDYSNSTWSGTPGNSTSTWSAPSVSELIDPDCPPLPAPPAPPSIDQECIDEPTAWTRYTIYIPADQVPLFSASVPVVTLRTGDATARQVRMRWYPNPDGQNVTQLPACSFEGEVIVSYVPPQAELVVDAIAREATATVNGGPEQPATQLLYGPDGGPMVWPELSCNQGYVFTVDVDSADDVSELDVLLSLGLKV